MRPRAKTIKAFLQWMLADGQKYAAGLSYAPLPKEVVAKEVKQIAKIQVIVDADVGTMRLRQLRTQQPSGAHGSGGRHCRPSDHVHFSRRVSLRSRCCWCGSCGSQSAPTRHKFGFAFLFTTTWDPVTEQFGALPFVYGTVVTSVLALLISVPLGLGAAIFLAELAPAAHLQRADVSDRASGGDSKRHLRPAGPLHHGSADAGRTVSRSLSRRLGFCRCFKGPFMASGFSPRAWFCRS